MASRKPLIDVDGDVRELTAEDMVKFMPAAEVLPLSLRKKLGVRGLQKALIKRTHHDLIVTRSGRAIPRKRRGLVNPSGRSLA